MADFHPYNNKDNNNDATKHTTFPDTPVAKYDHKMDLKMENKVEDKISTSKKKGVLQTFMETTSMKGFSRLVKSEILSLKILWFIAVVFGLSVTLYQVIELFKDYLLFSATTQIYVTREHAPFPDVSICNLEPNLDDVTSVRDYLTKLDDVITKNRGDIDVVSVVQGLKNKVSLFQNVQDQDINKDLISHCSWTTDRKEKVDCKDRVSRLVYTGNFGQCFTFSTLLMDDQVEASGIYNMKLLLYLDQFQSGDSKLNQEKFHQVPYMHGGGVKISVHEQRTLANIDSDGVTVSPGVRAELTLYPTRTQRLPTPYSDCENKEIVEDVLFDDYELKYTSYACREISEQKYIAHKCGCLGGELLSTPTLRGEYPFCDKVLDNISYTVERRDCAREWRANYSSFDWLVGCADPCDLYTYPTSMSSVPWPLDFQAFSFYDTHIKGKSYQSHFSEIPELESRIGSGDTNFSESLSRVSGLIRNNFINVEVQFQSLHVEYRIERASVSLESFVGSMGGILNLWSGITFIVVFELLELLFRSWRKLCSKSKRSDVIA